MKTRQVWLERSKSFPSSRKNNRRKIINKKTDSIFPLSQVCWPEQSTARPGVPGRRVRTPPVIWSSCMVNTLTEKRRRSRKTRTQVHFQPTSSSSRNRKRERERGKRKTSPESTRARPPSSPPSSSFVSFRTFIFRWLSSNSWGFGSVCLGGLVWERDWTLLGSV